LASQVAIEASNSVFAEEPEQPDSLIEMQVICIGNIFGQLDQVPRR
jgi:hypothetical protein